MDLQRAQAVAVSLITPLVLTVAVQQQTPVIKLAAPGASLGQFSRISSVRELSDGRVIAVDVAERRLVVADFASGSVREISRHGSGAGEYRAPNRIFVLDGDRSLVSDPPNGRWLLLVGDSVASQVSASAAVVRSIGPMPHGADSLGSVVTVRPFVSNGTPRLDSMLAIRATSGTGKVDTLGFVRNRRITLPNERIDLRRSVSISFNPLSVSEQIVAFPDGWVAIARLDPYRVEWFDPTGKRILGKPLPFEKTPVDKEVKQAAVEHEAELTGNAPRNPDAVADWPALLPPFLVDALVASPDGSLWIERTRNRAAPVYDVVDRNGDLVARIGVDRSERLVGFGRTTTYTVHKDADGFEKLRRHPARNTTRHHN
jgi:hypothetical protein